MKITKYLKEKKFWIIIILVISFISSSLFLFVIIPPPSSVKQATFNINYEDSSIFGNDYPVVGLDYTIEYFNTVWVFVSTGTTDDTGFGGVDIQKSMNQYRLRYMWNGIEQNSIIYNMEVADVYTLIDLLCFSMDVDVWFDFEFKDDTPATPIYQTRLLYNNLGTWEEIFMGTGDSYIISGLIAGDYKFSEDQYETVYTLNMGDVLLLDVDVSIETIELGEEINLILLSESLSNGFLSNLYITSSNPQKLFRLSLKNCFTLLKINRFQECNKYGDSDITSKILNQLFFSNFCLFQIKGIKIKEIN